MKALTERMERFESHDETLFLHADEPKIFKPSTSHEAATGLL
jgi:hypothetical protein